MVFINENIMQENEEGNGKEGYLCFSHTDQGGVIKRSALESDGPNSNSDCLLLGGRLSPLTSACLIFLICELGFITSHKALVKI